MRNIHYTLYRGDNDYFAQCLDFDVSSFGATEQEALHHLREAIELYLEDSPDFGPVPRMKTAENLPDAARFRRSAEHSSFQLYPITPFPRIRSSHELSQRPSPR